MELFEVKVGISDISTNENKKQLYLVDAMTFTEAEAKAIKAATPYSSSGVEIKSERKCRVEELLNADDENADYWYRVKVDFATQEDLNKPEKHSVSNYLIKAGSIDDAMIGVLKVIDDMLANGRIISIVETSIIDYIK